ncbi:hypothetical protein [Roseimicrobium sp. ORNL1]|uniref:hypothetical protein n=1 Tax=Roseimicrobium sp. ORNL1 TaxID=2711231 RepID=UPI0013E1865E|nr:hypothetical protein [Roseimicrobium sp. ORNL1]QIF01955.1 hypothetical protein G5S37_10580 [Roseimicrobium sp. ORNL1]
MSRRTKLIILAVFLVLLAIPAAYVALTWSPKDPLRVRLISMDMPGEQDPFKQMTMRMELENTSTVPIFVGDVVFRARRKTGVNGDPMFQRIYLFSPDGSSNWFHTIAPRSTQLFSADVTGYDQATVDMDSAEMVYLYESDTEHRINELWSRGIERVPYWITKHLPEPLSDSDQAAASIEPPPH